MEDNIDKFDEIQKISNNVKLKKLQIEYRFSKN